MTHHSIDLEEFSSRFRKIPELRRCDRTPSIEPVFSQTSARSAKYTDASQRNNA
ncbi:hypothetical protein [Spirulina sp. 06S082]|uniref:hypothetical protein n=1 Tax=Spirulina sp. 06S082 TaxID=3110248 RepID=UPI002B205CAB|nr:hypothetical protein [Spirulina sp. 06S082]MEA5467410.1 hypothetical protein [Spirulina sp. 06S082]